MTVAISERPEAPGMPEPRPDWQQISELTLAALPSAISCARMLVYDTLRGWDLDRRCANAIMTAMDELVVHAVATTGVTEELPLYHPAFDRLTLIAVKLRLTPQAAQIEVWDSGDFPPAPQLSQSQVIAASKRWGYDLPFPGKRVVWCEVSTRVRSDQNQEAGLPRRVARPVPLRPKAVGIDDTMPDVHLLERVRDGLRRLGRPEDPEKPC